jgi:putative tricarboxylic transport membrane protein
VVASFASYAFEKRIAKDPSRFGKGAIEGVAGPEAANNAAAQTAFVPTLTLGIPGNGTMALFLSAMIMYGVIPGPAVIRDQPELFWGLIASMWIGNVILVILNLPLIGIWVRLLRLPYQWLYPAIVLFMCIGTYSLGSQPAEVALTALFGVLGVVFYRLGMAPAPLLLGAVLGGILEENLRRALLLSRGDLTIFLTKPISLAFLLFAMVLVIISIIQMKRKNTLETQK